MTARRRSLFCVLAAVALIAGCSSGAGSPSSPPPTSSTAPSSASTSPPPPSSTPTPTPTTTSAPARQQLPQGGTSILMHYRLVAYYGVAGNATLGVLGSADAETIADQVEARAQEWVGYGKPVQPAMELITSVASGGPGPDGLYSNLQPLSTVQHYLDVAHEHKMLLMLDFQPGRGEFLPQVQAMESIISDPSVEVALDPEWKMGPNEVPAQVIGSSSAASVNAVRDYLSDLVKRKNLPDKLLMIHQFTLAMLPDRQHITPATGVEIVFHADGFGSQGAKEGTWNNLDFPGRPYGTGFKLFLVHDIGLMSPDQVMALTPRPDVITYQ